MEGLRDGMVEGKTSRGFDLNGHVFYLFIFKFNLYPGIAVHYTVTRPARLSRIIPSTQQILGVQWEDRLQTEQKGEGGVVCKETKGNYKGWWT